MRQTTLCKLGWGPVFLPGPIPDHQAPASRSGLVPIYRRAVPWVTTGSKASPMAFIGIVPYC